MDTDQGYPPLSAWQTGFRGLCPRCGAAPLYDTFLHIREECPSCGLDLTKEDAGDGAVPFIIILISTVGVGLGVFVMFAFDTPVWTPIVVACPVVAGLGLYLLPKVKGLLVALQYLNRAGDIPENTFDR